MSGPTPKIPENREIRVFISSTFRDMQAERDELAKFVFPELRKLCRQRDVTWSSVDLRWGIPEGEANRVGILSICLEEIQRCRPYFIGILGERYGWIPDQVDPGALESEPWLADLENRSITELEILHGVLNDPEMADHAFFYFRDPAYLKTVPPDQRDAYREKPDTEAARKLAELKAVIRSSGMPLVEDFSDPRALGERVGCDFTQLIDTLFPPETAPTPLERERQEQGVFAKGKTRAYIPRHEAVVRLDQHVAGAGPPLTVLGESGAGKTALLAHWIGQHRQGNPSDFTFMHLIGSTAASTDWKAMLRRCIGELQIHVNLDEGIEDDPEDLRIQFANWLSIAASQARVILVIDALDQLEDRQGAPDLIWLPETLPDNVRVILSTLPGRPLEAIQKRGWPTYKLTLLSVQERAEIARSYLSLYRKRLSKSNLQRIAEAPQAANPLFLKMLLNELRLFGEHEQLSQRIEQYLEAPSIESLFEKILVRFEQDYNRDRPDLVQDALRWIYASRRGLTEFELRNLLGQDDKPLPQAYWSPFYLAAEASLVNRNGRIDFFHNYFRAAVGRRYLATLDERRIAHLQLASYFAAQELDVRQVEELPWQYQQAEEWDSLVACVRNPDFIKSAWDRAELDLRSYWSDIVNHGKHTPQQAYRPLLRSPEENFDVLGPVAELLYFSGATVDALALQEERIKLARRTDRPVEHTEALFWKARILRERGEFSHAMEIYQGLENLYRDIKDDLSLASILNSQAVMLKKQGDLQGALKLHSQQEKIVRDHDDRRQLAVLLHNKGTILTEQGEYQQALNNFKEAEQIARAYDDRDFIAESHNAQAVVLDRMGKPEKALALLEQAEGIQRALGDTHTLQATLGNRANILRRQGRLDEAQDLIGEQGQITRDLDDKEGLSASLNQKALVLKSQGDLEGALKLFKEMESVSRDSGSAYTLQSALGNQASILHQQGQLDEALIIRKEEINICRKAGFKDDLATALYTASELLYDLKRYEEALPLAQEGYDIAQELGLEEIAQELEMRWFPP